MYDYLGSNLNIYPLLKIKHNFNHFNDFSYHQISDCDAKMWYRIVMVLSFNRGIFISIFTIFLRRKEKLTGILSFEMGESV